MFLAEIRAAGARRAASAPRAQTPPPTDAPVEDTAPSGESAPAPATELSTEPSTEPESAADSSPDTATAGPPQVQSEIDKFKHQLAIGVLPRAVLQKMGAAGIDVSVLDIVFDPADLAQVYWPAYRATQPQDATPVAPSPSTPPVTSSKRKNLHLKGWLPPKPELETKIETAVWPVDPSCIEIPEVIHVRYDELFGKPTPTGVARLPSATPALTSTLRTALIDGARTFNIGILLSGMKLSPDEWRECVFGLTFDEKRSASLNDLLQAWPTSDEARAIDAYEGDGSDLSPVESFFVGLRDIPRLKEKMESLAYRLTFSSRQFELGQSMWTVIRGVNQLIDNESFVAVLQKIFALYCTIEKGRDYPHHQHRGLSVSDLPKLMLNPSKPSILNALVWGIEELDPTLGQFAEQLPELASCAKVSVAGLHGELASLQSGLNKLICEAGHTADIGLPPGISEGLREFGNNARIFAQEVQLKLQYLRELLAQVEDACRRLVMRFGDPETTFAEFILTISSFVEAFATERIKMLDECKSLQSPSALIEENVSPPLSETSTTTLGSDGEQLSDPAIAETVGERGPVTVALVPEQTTVLQTPIGPKFVPVSIANVVVDTTN